MKTRTNITTEYAPCGLTTRGKWRPLTVFSPIFGSAPAVCRSKEEAERTLEEIKETHDKNPKVYKGCKDFKVMKRTVVITISELEEA